MKKMRLNLDGLEVESFVTGTGTHGGTVLAKEEGSSEQGGCGTDGIGTQYCPPAPTAHTCTYAPENTCQTCEVGTCDFTCRSCPGQATCGGASCASCFATCGGGTYGCDSCTGVPTCCIP